MNFNQLNKGICSLNQTCLCSNVTIITNNVTRANITREVCNCTDRATRVETKNATFNRADCSCMRVQNTTTRPAFDNCSCSSYFWCPWRPRIQNTSCACDRIVTNATAKTSELQCNCTDLSTS